MNPLYPALFGVALKTTGSASNFSATHAAHFVASGAPALKIQAAGSASSELPVSPADVQSKTEVGLLKTHRLVVVDDDARFRESLCSLLQSKGYPAPASCASGRELLNLLMEAPFDLVLLDLRLHDLSGLDVLGMVRQASLDVAVVVLSGDAMIDSAISALRLGANDYVRKPYASEMLLHTVEAVLQRRDLENSHRKMATHLERSERIYHFLVDTSPDLIFTLDEHCNFSFVSERVASLIHCRSDELFGLPFTSIIYEEDLQRTRYLLECVCRGASTTELRFVSRDDSTPRYFEVSLIPVDFCPAKSYQGNGRFCSIYGVARDVSEKKLANDRLAYLAHHDVLTGLPNRALFRDRVGLALIQAKRSNLKVATLFIDLDRFKLANDTFGHQKGDELLKAVARRLHDNLRETDTLARIGGDEFSVLLAGFHSQEDVALVAGKLVADMAKPFLVSGNEVFLTASIGISIYPKDGEDIETLQRKADIAMYDVKAHGKNSFRFFSSSMGEATSRRLSIENEIRHALEDGQFELHYQLQVDATTQKVVGLEALSRWRHPSKGLIAAGGFVPVVEEIGLMPALTYWVLETSCQDLRTWWDRGFDMPRMSVNVSPCVLELDDFQEHLLAILQKYSIAHEKFEIEITENVFIGDRQKVTDRLLRISQERIRIAIDDFGTQYSSLSYLRYLPVSTLKIDQSFVREIKCVDDSSPIVRAIVAIAAGLGLNVVAEGVETEEQAGFLRSLGCREMQGYLYGRPLPVEKIEAFLFR